MVMKVMTMRVLGPPPLFQMSDVAYGTSDAPKFNPNITMAMDASEGYVILLFKS